MFAKAKRFNYPKVDELQTPTCNRFSYHEKISSASLHDKSRLSRSSPARTSNKIKCTPNATSKSRNDYSTFTTPSLPSLSLERSQKPCNPRTISSTSSIEEIDFQFNSGRDSGAEVSPNFSPDLITKSHLLQKLETMEAEFNKKMHELEHSLNGRLQAHSSFESALKEQLNNMQTTLCKVEQSLNNLSRTQESNEKVHGMYNKTFFDLLSNLMELSVKLHKRKKRSTFRKFMELFNKSKKMLK